jgi:uncharacterized protein (TIGR03083 family)
MAVVDALAREVGNVSKLLHSLKHDEWSKPTRCKPLTIRELASHVTRGGVRIQEMIDGGPVDTEPELDGVTYFQYDPAAQAPRVVSSAQEAAQSFPADLAKTWDTEWTKALQRAREHLGEDLVYRTIFGLIRLSEYLRTRCVEVAIHHMDLDDALGKQPHPDPGAIEAVGDVLRGLLGTDLRPVGVDDVRFALIGSGRAPLSEDERALLGPLADKFPLFS